MAPPKGGLFSWNVQLIYLINFAYDLKRSQVKGGVWEQLPKWATDEWYSVEARAEGNPTREDVRQMVRSLLEERFKLSAHKAMVDGQIYELVVSKPGLGLKPHPQDASCTISLPRPAFAYPSYSQVPARCGFFNRQLGPHDEMRRLEMLNLTMHEIADELSTELPLSVHDETGLSGHYDAILDYGPGQLPPDNDSVYEVGAPLPVALEKQLGLKLIKKNAPVATFTIDHIEQPSGN